VFLEQAESTNTEALRLAAQGRTSIWVVAGRQTQGRGRRGRQWLTPECGLAASLIVPLGATPAKAALLAYLCAVAVAEAIEHFLATAAVSLKWPNDVLLDGAKVGGILIESLQDATGSFAAVCGIGVNCGQPPARQAYPVTSLQEHGIAADAPAFFSTLSNRVADCLELWDDGGNFDAIRSKWRARARDIGHAIRIEHDGTVHTGIFKDIHDSGALVLSNGQTGDKFITNGTISRDL
jgi:biotin-[acetyl-CoA-carboxylase] ligase BirA-like protein